MKIVKGVLIYTVLIIGICLVLGMLIVGCMFIFPKFEVFGWKVMHKSNDIVKDNHSSSLASGDYTIEIDAGLHAVNVVMFSDSTKYVLVNKYDDMFGFYKGEYNNEVKFEYPANNKITISLGSVDGAVLPRKSRIDVYLPHSHEYDLIIRTTSGDININGASSKDSVDQLKVKSLDITTTSGDFAWSNVRSTIVKEGNAGLYGHTIVDSIDTKAEGFNKDDYKRFVFLNSLKAKTNTGKFDFSVKNDDVFIGAIAPTTIGNEKFIDVITMTDFGKLEGWLMSMLTTEPTKFYFEADRGEFNFTDIVSYGGLSLNFVGQDVLVKAGKIIVGPFNSDEAQIDNKKMFSFYFNAPNGFFDIKELSATLSTIITNNIDIKLENVTGELSVTTTYGNIEIGEISHNASLSSTHGNITVKNTSENIIAISEYGDITVNSYSGGGYLKNRHGKITANFNKEWYNENKSSITVDEYPMPMEMVSEDGSITANNLVFETIIQTTAGGTINANFMEMYKAASASDVINHKITLNGGRANVTVPNTQAFWFKGTGSISGSVGSVPMTATEDFVTILTPNNEEEKEVIARLEVKTTSGSINFTTATVQ